ncbi:RNA polymerase subunit sigma-70 [Hymenobacter edaphi]|uniref:RNA polymerase subunit sigma-70 n=2 Tax=Hymenobacter edaphi TaxID=2211146 RepID=A0A328BD85_9BACT|nr:RNA polymerase subunit sigma-70 [Hymenobacter edaphi]
MTTFYDLYGRTLYRIIRAFVPGEAAAEDVLQESLIKIWNGFGSYDPARGRLYTWAVNICRHQALDYLRQAHVRGVGRTDAWHDVPTAAEPAASGGFVPEHLDVRACLAYLRPAYRRVLELRYFEGLKLEEVAELLALPLGTVKTQQRQALRQLAGLWR